MTEAWLDEINKLAAGEQRRERVKRILLAAGATGGGALAGRLLTSGALKLLERRGRIPTKAVRSIADYAGPALGAALVGSQFLSTREAGRYAERGNE